MGLGLGDKARKILGNLNLTELTVETKSAVLHYLRCFLTPKHHIPIGILYLSMKFPPVLTVLLVGKSRITSILQAPSSLILSPWLSSVRTQEHSKGITWRVFSGGCFPHIAGNKSVYWWEVERDCLCIT